MFSWTLLVDIGLVGLAAVTQAATSFLGWRAATRKLSTSRRKGYEKGFLWLAVLGVMATVVTAYRGASIGADLMEIKVRQGEERLELNQLVQNTAPSEDPKHTRMNWLNPWVVSKQFQEGQQPAVNVAYNNNGNLPIRNPRQHVKVLLVSGSEAQHVFEKHRTELEAISPTLGSVLNPHTNIFSYHTFFGNALTASELDQLNNRTAALCVIGVGKWEDDSGEYATDLEACLVKDVQGFIWHVSPQTNLEHKLR